VTRSYKVHCVIYELHFGEITMNHIHVSCFAACRTHGRILPMPGIHSRPFRQMAINGHGRKTRPVQRGILPCLGRFLPVQKQHNPSSRWQWCDKVYCVSVCCERAIHHAECRAVEPMRDWCVPLSLLPRFLAGGWKADSFFSHERTGEGVDGEMEKT
jgi:hypothetical protein